MKTWIMVYEELCKQKLFFEFCTLGNECFWEWSELHKILNDCIKKVMKISW